MSFNSFLPSRTNSLTDGGTSIRVALMGAKGVGKSSIAQRYVHKRFSDEYKETIEEVYLKQVGHRTIEILDTCGDDSFPVMRQLVIDSCHAFILVYAVDDVRSFDYVSDLRDRIISKRGSLVPIIVVGNKSDLTIRKVSDVLADCIVSIDWENKYHEVSAKTNHNVTLLFQELLSSSAFRLLCPASREDNDSPFIRRRTMNASFFQRAPKLAVNPEIEEIKEIEHNNCERNKRKKGIRSRFFKFLRPLPKVRHGETKQ
ncbi:MAG: GTP-binding protein [Candidatus Thiodiazotropha sp.]